MRQGHVPHQTPAPQPGGAFAMAARAIWHTQRVKRLIRDRIGHGVPCLVSVQETRCEDPGCEGPATEVRIVTMDGRQTRFLIHKPPAAIAASDVAGAF